MSWRSLGTLRVSAEWQSSDPLPAGTALLRLHGGTTGHCAWVALQRASSPSVAGGILYPRPVSFFVPRLLLVPPELRDAGVRVAVVGRFRRWFGLDTNWDLSINYWHENDE